MTTYFGKIAAAAGNSLLELLFVNVLGMVSFVVIVIAHSAGIFTIIVQVSWEFTQQMVYT